MTQESISRARGMTAEQSSLWLISLAWEITVAARGSYPVEQIPGSIAHLVGFNELQHQIFNFLQHRAKADDWAIESLLDALYKKAAHYGIEGEFQWAVDSSLKQIGR